MFMSFKMPHIVILRRILFQQSTMHLGFHFICSSIQQHKKACNVLMWSPNEAGASSNPSNLCICKFQYPGSRGEQCHFRVVHICWGFIPRRFRLLKVRGHAKAFLYRGQFLLLQARDIKPLHHHSPLNVQ